MGIRRLEASVVHGQVLPGGDGEQAEKHKNLGEYLVGILALLIPLIVHLDAFLRFMLDIMQF